jgi:hypothetical protein
MRRRVWTVAATLLLVLALMPLPVAAATGKTRMESKTRGGLAVLWEAVLGMLSPHAIFERLGAGMDPGGNPTAPPHGTLGTGGTSRPPHPESDLGPGMDPLG